ncbi:MbcA/ParS/Xre antitoxin family protein [Marinobacter sp. CHS3-4]|uniref:MbcA/ParS/Xre antitoxin family protein n=1 Tax=Marinobacter sp. CHS3-4 TaxID=3045174 RepID=UPI0024B53F23|nr:MbcA/ParS/Xre antitoxin family protein [Marinobacter sp. CHS3-4]MDI9245395.1 MbcA/ParS/Xre antitoxin family protein [Marinobacter sp. CHS3-4]
MSQASALPRNDSDQMSAAGLKAVFAILDRWGCSADQVQKILQVSRPAYYKYRKNPAQTSLSQDQLERISYLLNIHSALRTLFENPKNVYGFMALKNDNPFFNGKSPLDIISTGQFAALYETFKRIDALRGGLW